MGLGKIFARRDYPLDAITPAAGGADPACDAAHLLHEDGDERHEPEGSAIRHGTLGHQDDAWLLHPHDLGRRRWTRWRTSPPERWRNHRVYYFRSSKLGERQRELSRSFIQEVAGTPILCGFGAIRALPETAWKMIKLFTIKLYNNYKNNNYFFNSLDKLLF